MATDPTSAVTFQHYMLIALPEIAMALGALIILVYGVARGDRSVNSVAALSILLMLGAAALVFGIPGEKLLAFGDSFVVDPFSDFVKILLLLASSVSILISLSFLKMERLAHFEFPILVTLATLGMMVMVSANDLIVLYIGLELQSLSLYVLAAFNRDSARSTEAGLKYFVLGALSSGLLLFGCSYVYGFVGSTNFIDIANTLSTDAGPSLGVTIGLVFIAAALAFKVSAVPFHMWTPDVYEGAPTPITALFAAAPKLAAMALFVRVLLGPFEGIAAEWQQVIVFISAASMILGAFAAIGQNNIKRLMAYSSIGHMGYALMGLAAGTQSGVRSVLIYLSIYLVMTLGTFVCILMMRRREGMVEQISDLAGLSRSRPRMAFALAMLMFSLAGIPPLVGFFPKWYVFFAAVEANLLPLAIIGALSSVVAAFYYLRVIKVIYLDEPAEAFVDKVGIELRAVLAVSTVAVVFGLFALGPLNGAANEAACAFFECPAVQAATNETPGLLLPR